MLVMFIFMNTGSATAAIHVMVDVVHGNVNAKSAKTKAWRALLHRSVTQITNDVEACYWQPPAKCFVRTEFVAFMASGSWRNGRLRPSLHSFGAAIIQAAGLASSSSAGMEAKPV
jgi:hypothetical protein